MIHNTSSDGLIFINYRQQYHDQDKGGTKLRAHVPAVAMLAQRLAHHFGQDRVFIDTGMHAGSKYPHELEHALARSTVVLSIIHREWLDDLDDRRDRSGPDWVKHELNLALNWRPDRFRDTVREQLARTRGPEVVPVLLDDAELPSAGRLPGELAELTKRQAYRLQFERMTDSLDRLLAELETHIATPGPHPEPHRRRAPRPTTGRKVVTWGLIAFMAATATATATPHPRVPLLAAMMSTLFMTAPLVAVTALALVRERLYKIEREFDEMPRSRYVAIVVPSVMIVWLVLLVPQRQENPGLVMVIIIPMMLVVFWVVANIARIERDDLVWPPKPSTNLVDLRRSIVRLRHNLTTWRRPHTRVQRDQAWQVYNLLVDTKEQFVVEARRTRQAWLLHSHPNVTTSYSVWLSTTTGLAIAIILMEDGLRGIWHALLVIITAGTFCLTTAELGFRNQRHRKERFIDEVERQLTSLHLDMPNNPHMAPLGSWNRSSNQHSP